MAKRVRVSRDDGTTWHTLPGNTAEASDEAGEIDDTIFGQDFESTQSGLIGWTINANGLMKGFAGYQAKILKSGSTTAMTDQAMSLVTGKTYQVTDATKRLMDRAVTVVVEDNSVAVDAEDILNIDFLFGRVTFASGYTPTGPITITGSYFPTSVVGCTNEYTLTQTANANDATCMDTAQANDGQRIFEYGLKTVNLELNGIYKAANGLRALLRARSELIIEINPDGNGKTVARGFFKATNTGQSGDVGDIEQETVTFNLSVPDDERIPFPFHWLVATDSTLNQAIEDCIDAWENKELIRVAYLPDGDNGWQGDAVVTDLTLTGGLEGMNEFTVNFQGSDAAAVYPTP
jgi:hypothetical protein